MLDTYAIGLDRIATELDRDAMDVSVDVRSYRLSELDESDDPGLTDRAERQSELLRSLTDGVPYEDLEPELFTEIKKGRHNEKYIHHPLLVTRTYFSDLNAQYNRVFRLRRKSLAAAHESKNWKVAVSIHERPFRMSAFVSYADEMGDEEYWSTIRDLWLDPRVHMSGRDRWPALLASKRSGREHLMLGPDMDLYDSLVDPVRVYRGTSETRKPGISWTLDQDVAHRYARKAAASDRETKMVLIGEVYKCDIIATFARDSEILSNAVREVGALSPPYI